MTALFLGVSAGVCFYAAVHHLQVAVHLRNRSPHLLLTVSGIAFGLLALRSIHFFIAVPVDVMEDILDSAVPLGVVGLGALYWFVGSRAGVSRGMLWVAVAGLAVAAIVNQLAPAGILSNGVRELQPVRLPWGDVYERPLTGGRTLALAVLLPGLLVPTLVLLRAVVIGHRRGRLPEAGILGAIVLTATVPAVVTTVVLPLGSVPFPMATMGFTSAMVLLSILTSRDVAQTTILEEDLLRSEERFRRLVDTAPQAIALFDSDGHRCVGANARAEELLGQSLGELRAHSLDDFLGTSAAAGDEGHRVVHALREHALGGQAATIEWELTRTDQTRVPCELRFTAQQSGSRRLVCVSLLDITERKEAERSREAVESRLRQAERLETLGTLAGGIAHDFNNMLTPIVGYGDLALDELHDHPARHCVLRMHAAAERARQLNRHILTFGRQVDSPQEVFLLQPVVQQSLRFLRATLPARIAVVSELAAPDVHVRGTPAEFHQVVMSLGTNAAEAMEGEGQLQVTLRGRGGHVELTVVDTGPGIDERTLPRIFDPFFSTKTERRSSGLGLSVVHGVVTAAGGSIDVVTKAGEGTRFVVRVPLSRGPS